MSDQRLRDLERAAASGDPGAEAALLAERLRAGALTPEVARARAALGDPAARTALGLPPLRDATEYGAALATVDPRHLARGLVAVLRAALGDDRSHPLQRATGLLLQVLDEWARSARPEARVAVQRSMQSTTATLRGAAPGLAAVANAALTAAMAMLAEPLERGPDAAVEEHLVADLLQRVIAGLASVGVSREAVARQLVATVVPLLDPGARA